MTFLQWGTAGAGGFGLGDYLRPSVILEAGFRAAYPLKVVVDNFGYFPPPVLLIAYMTAYWSVVIGFGFICIHVMCASSKSSWRLRRPRYCCPGEFSARPHFLAKWRWDNSRRGVRGFLMTSILMAVAINAFTVVQLPPGDGSYTQAGILAICGLVFAILTWIIPNRAARMGE